ncbi:hypothetical protein SCP_0204010 [Sparassis crispa]|uniref:Nucleoporin n=1 Tax=Sparassis crispa TaxID=139825 RepID=A0A401GAK7_9APHY|nr:hypothetical protein SCP_0204010 [Sparassis crispa]GBE79204.1 hypothetical protein SCP_0204010 [Sparassis crispa]
MECGVLVASHLSSLFPSSLPISVPTSHKDILSLSVDSSAPLEHASYSTLFHTSRTGTILLRLTHRATLLELITLTCDAPQLRFDFPGAILPSPAVFLWEERELHVIAVSVVGSLYRFVLPLQRGAQLWHPSRYWFRQYDIQNMRSDMEGLVQVHGPHCVVLSLPGGALLRLEAELLGNDDEDDVWQETKFHPHSLLTSITSLLPLQGGPPGSSDIISMASFPQPTDIEHVWTLSRDRTLRLWTARSGCVAEKSLAAIIPGKAMTPASTSASSSGKLSNLLPADAQKLLSVFPEFEMEDPVPYVLAFIPAESSSTSGGYFHLFSSHSSDLHPLNYFECSVTSAHCHLQDFVVIGSTLYTVWDKQGQSMVEDAKVSFHDGNRIEVVWNTATYAHEAELTPAYLEELLLSAGSMADKFFEAISRPGIFSSVTLRTAIDQYTDACRSLPPPYTPQLLTTYGSVGEQIAAVVGCTVELTRDPSTGAPQYDRYWNALKRDWEGFVARCREIERHARWPLAICMGEPREGILVVERERIAALVDEDFPLRSRRLLAASSPLDPQFTLLEILWTLRAKIGTRSMLVFEDRLVDLVHQEIAFPYADIIQDQAERINIREELDEGMQSWIAGRLQSIDNMSDAIQSVLNVIGGLEKNVKKEVEDEDAALRLPPAYPEWRRALVSSYVAVSVQARYDLCLSLVTLLFFVSEDLPQWDPASLAEIFVVFRGIAMLRYATRQPAAGSVSTPAAEPLADEEVVAKMRDMHVSSTASGFTPSYSLIHRLLTQYGSDAASVPASAHLFLDSSGLLESLSPANATKLEVLFCERLRLLGYREASRESLMWLPRTAGVTYVLGRLWLDEGRYDDAASVMEGVAVSFGRDSALTTEDHEALAGVLPGAAFFQSVFDFYLHVAGLFKAVSVTSSEVVFSQLALSVAPPGVDTASLWHAVIRGLTDLGLYEDAYAALVSTPYEKLKRECVSQLMYRMCEEHAVDRLMALNFAGFVDEVEESLSFKARNADPRVRPFYSRILYTWYISRGDYRNAALTMYQRARKLASLFGDPANFIEIAELQLEAYVVGMNALALTDQKNAWIVLPVTAESEHEPRKRRKLSRYIPEDKYGPGKRDMEVVELADMQYEYTLLAIRLELIRRDPTLLSAGEALLSPPSVVLRLTQANRFNMAMATARTLNVDMTDLFGHLTGLCLRLSRNPEAVIGEDTSDWLLTDKVTSWPGTAADRGWRYLRESLERHDGPDTDYRYTKVTLETILELDRTSPPPQWLTQSLEVHHPEYLIRTCLRYEMFEGALEHTLSLMRRSDAHLAQERPKAASVTWLPYTLIDQVLAAVDTQQGLPIGAQSLRKELRTEISNRIKRVQKFGQSVR